LPLLDYIEQLHSAELKYYLGGNSFVPLKLFEPVFDDYTSHGYGCGKYIELFFVDSKALKQAHS